MRKKELLRLLEEQRERVAQLEQCVKTQDRLIDGYQSREHAIVAALENAHEVARQRIDEAERQAQEIAQQAKRESARMLAETEATVAEYQESIAQYNSALERAAAEAAANAERFACFAKGKKLREGEIAREVRGISDLPLQEPVPLPDVVGNPAQLMRNIYRIQNRALPDEAELAVPEEPVSTPEPEPVQPEPAEEPIPEAAAEDVVDELLEEEPVVHTVAAVLEDSDTGDDGQEVSLDALLDEIIKSGEQNNG